MSKEKIKKQLREAIVKNPSVGKIKKAALFGSYAYGKPGRNSDIDLLIEFDAPIGMFEFVAIEEKLAREIKKKVDLVTPNGLSKYIRKAIMQKAEPVYERR